MERIQQWGEYIKVRTDADVPGDRAEFQFLVRRLTERGRVLLSGMMRRARQCAGDVEE